jgi:hypothetical protein
MRRATTGLVLVNLCPVRATDRRTLPEMVEFGLLKANLAAIGNVTASVRALVLRAAWGARILARPFVSSDAVPITACFDPTRTPPASSKGLVSTRNGRRCKGHFRRDRLNSMAGRPLLGGVGWLAVTGATAVGGTSLLSRECPHRAAVGSRDIDTLWFGGASA